jgi:hypothetical protein
MWKKVDQAVEPNTRVKGGAANQEPTTRRNDWTVMMKLTVELDSEHQAREIINDILSQIDVPPDGHPTVVPRGGGYWTTEVKLDLTAVPVIDPDDARTRISYVTRNIEGVTWRVVQANEYKALFEWPPGHGDTSRRDGFLGHSAIHAVAIRASLD